MDNNEDESLIKMICGHKDAAYNHFSTDKSFLFLFVSHSTSRYLLVNDLGFQLYKTKVPFFRNRVNVVHNPPSLFAPPFPPSFFHPPWFAPHSSFVSYLKGR